ncbi:hypothetical protein J6590_025047 [Homalodisca vitripennis]|nr:hypothetical protein J6590_025047 [Homalodisca vitripennis]
MGRLVSVVLVPTSTGSLAVTASCVMGPYDILRTQASARGLFYRKFREQYYTEFGPITRLLASDFLTELSADLRSRDMSRAAAVINYAHNGRHCVSSLAGNERSRRAESAAAYPQKLSRNSYYCMSWPWAAECSETSAENSVP